MELGYSKANSSNLPKIDAVTLGRFFAANSGFCSLGFEKMYSQASYGDEAIRSVQLMRDNKLCTVKCEICPKQKDDTKIHEDYGVTLIVDEEDDAIVSVQCHNCVAARGCKHVIALLMWVHHKSVDPSCNSDECHWRKTELSNPENNLKYITAKDMGNGSPLLPANTSVLTKFLEEGRKRKIENCALLKYQPTYCSDKQAVFDQPIFNSEVKCVKKEQLNLTKSLVVKIEIETMD